MNGVGVEQFDTQSPPPRFKNVGTPRAFMLPVGNTMWPGNGEKK